MAQKELLSLGNQVVSNNVQTEKTEQESKKMSNTIRCSHNYGNQHNNGQNYVDCSIEYDLRTPMTFTQPYAVKYKGKKHFVKNLREMYICICSELYTENPAKFRSFIYDPEMQGQKIPWVTDRRENLPRVARPIAHSGLFVYANLDANHIQKRLLTMLKKMNINSDAVKIFFDRM